MESIARKLKERREAMGQTLRQVQEATKIRIKYLQALEDADPSAFPGEVYLKGYLRAYAEYLGLNAHALLEEYNRVMGTADESAPDAPRTSVPLPDDAAADEASRQLRSRRRRVPDHEEAPAPEPRRAIHAGESGDVEGLDDATRSRRSARARHGRPRLGGPEALETRRTPIAAIVVLVAFLAGGGWWILRHAQPASSGRDTAPPASTVPSEPSDEAHAPSEVQPSEPPSSEPAPAVDVQRSTDPSGDIVFTVRHAASVEVSIRFSGPCWVRAIADGREIDPGTTYKNGDERTWSAQNELRVTVGYAGHVELSVNGVAQGPVADGPRVKTVRFVNAGE